MAYDKEAKPTYNEMIKIESRFSTMKGAAESEGFPVSTWATWKRKYLNEIVEAEEHAEDGLSFPELPEKNMDPEGIIEFLCKNFTTKQNYQEAWNWAEYGVSDNLPIGLVVVGDIHLDANGCHWPRLDRDLKLCASTPGVQCINIGDLHNNWVGTLQRLYAEQETSKETAYVLIKHVLSGMGVPWMLHLIGNHDAWGDGAEVLKRMGATGIIKDWEAKVKLVFPNGFEYKIHAAHNFKGQSMYSNTHGSNRKALMAGPDQAHLYCSGHTHTYGVQQQQANNDMCPLHVQARGYKFIDDYATRGGFTQDTTGASIMVIVDPETEDLATRSIAFADIHKGAQYLTWLREDRRKTQ